MDSNTLVAVLGVVALICLLVYGCFALMHGIDNVLTIGITASFTAIVTAVATYLKTRQ